MKKMSRVLALCLALLLALSGIVLAEEADQPAQEPETAAPEAADAAAQEPAEENPVLLNFDGEDVTKATIDEMLVNLVNNGYISSDKDYATAIEYWIQDQVIFAKIKELGLDQFTAEEEEAFLADAQSEWDEAIDTYVSYFLSEDTDEAREKARADGEAYYQAYGYNVDVLAENLKLAASYEKLEEKMLEGKNVTPTDEEIRQIFEEYAEQDKALYEGNVSLYELYQNYGQESWYMPAGYRGIIHILLEVDDELLKNYQDLQVAYEESLSAEESAEATAAPAEEDSTAAPTEKPVTQEDVDAALNAILDSRAKDIDDIYARLEKGEAFESLIAEYGTDPGMENEDMLKNGYEVHQDSIMWDPAFTAAAFSERMQKPGDVSDPVVGSYGIHILHYLRDIPEGYVDLNDDIRTQIESYLSNQKINAVYTEALEEWTGEHTIVYNTEAIDVVSAAEASDAEG